MTQIIEDLTKESIASTRLLNGETVSTKAGFCYKLQHGKLFRASFPTQKKWTEIKTLPFLKNSIL